MKLKELTPPGGGPSEANRIKSKGERRHADSINLSGLKIWNEVQIIGHYASLLDSIKILLQSNQTQVISVLRIPQNN